MRQITVGIVTAAVIGVWAFASTRASSHDLERVEIESRSADAALNQEIRELRTYLHELDVEQSAFRAQVREALSIK
ncbi:MAG: hypothetical protein HRT57_05800 [Crocinitomicaceae bacterium]|nr:hypothetical protein [Crocinitomicaceae bacterium]